MRANRDFEHSVDSDGSCYAAGGYTEKATPTEGDIVVYKLNPSGTEVWNARILNPGYDEHAYDVCVPATGRVAFIGRLGRKHASTNAATHDLHVRYLDSADGATLWWKTYNGALDQDELPKGITADAAGNVYAFGSASESSLAPRSPTILKYTPAGVLTKYSRSSGDQLYFTGPWAVKFDRHNNLFWVGATIDAGVTYALVVKLRQSPVATQNTYVCAENGVLSVSAANGVMANDQHTQNASVQLVKTTSFGTLSLQPNGAFTYTPQANFRSQDYFDYRLVRGTEVSAPARVFINVNHRLKDFTLSAASVVGGNPVTGTVTVTGPANPTTVGMTDNTGSINTPATITVPSGATMGSASIGTMGVGAAVTRQITASFNGVSITRNLTLNPAALSSLVILPSTVQSGQQTTGEVRLNGAVPTNRSISITDNSSAVGTPSSVVVAANASKATFGITTSPVSSTVTRQVTATYNGISRVANITLSASNGIANFTVSPSTVKGGASSTGTVTLAAAAPSGGATVAITDNSGAINTPPSVTVPAGTSIAKFTIGTSAVTATATRQVTVSLNGTSRTANLTLTP